MPIGKLIRMVQDTLAPGAEEPAERQQEAIRGATAAILLDIANADSSMTETEEKQVIEHLRSAFDLPDETARELLEAGEEIRSRTIDHWHLTHLVRNHTSFEERREIVRTMWRIIYADGYFHQYEGYLVRKLSELLGLQHHVMIEVKLEVRQELGLE